jgi:putative membrane protein
MSLNAEAFIKSLILLGFSTFLFWLVESNKIVFYINPRFVWLTEAAAVLIFLMFLVQAGNSYRRTSANHSHCHSGQSKIKLALLPFVVTLLMAFLLPDNALDASLAYNKGMNLNARPVTSGQSGPSSTVPSNVPVTQTNNNSTDPKAYDSLSKDSYQSMVDELRKSSLIKVTEENYTLITSEINMYPDKYVGKEIAMLGFVFRDQDFPSNQFGLVRYVVSCCSADAIIDGFLCEYNNASDLSKGSWLNIRGTIQKGEYENIIIPMIKVTSYSKGQEPKSPYIYPFNY